MNIKWLAKEARIITENWDCDNLEKMPNGLKNEDSSDFTDALEQMTMEKQSPFEVSMRYELIRIINNSYDIQLDIDGLRFEHGDKSISTFREYPGTTRLQYRGTLKEVPNSLFREMIADCLRIIPGGLQDFREMAEDSPYIF
jgi:hypothetical protein